MIFSLRFLKWNSQTITNPEKLLGTGDNWVKFQALPWGRWELRRDTLSSQEHMVPAHPTCPHAGLR